MTFRKWERDSRLFKDSSWRRLDKSILIGRNINSHKMIKDILKPPLLPISMKKYFKLWNLFNSLNILLQRNNGVIGRMIMKD